MPGPWEKYGSAPHSGGVFTLPPDEQTVRQNARNDASDRRDAQSFDLRAREFAATHKADGSPNTAESTLDPQTLAFYAQIGRAHV